MLNFKTYDVTNWNDKQITIKILSDISKSKDNRTMKFS